MDTVQAPSVLFVGKANDEYCERAAQFLRQHFPRHAIIMGGRGEAMPELARSWRGDLVVSYLSPWIIEQSLLDRASLASINFHPGPPEYPGIGCTNFAIYNQEQTFGITCHHMAAKVDTGKLIAVRRFALYPSDSVYSLTQRCYAYILTLYYEVMSLVLERKPLPICDEHWTRKPYRRKQLDALCRITADMDPDEIRRRVRAVTFPNAPGAYIELAGVRFDALLHQSEQ
jgi:methionyl-tRNA formyltransferase